MADIRVFVNGYGATTDLNDSNYHYYLSCVCACAREHGSTDNTVHVYFAGGTTNRRDISEAACMSRIFRHLGYPSNVQIHLIEGTRSARENMLRFRQEVGDVPVVIFCEQSRAWTMRFYAGRLFSSFTMQPVPFDAVSLTLTHRAKQLLMHLPLEIAAWYVPPVNYLRHVLRSLHIQRVRHRERTRV